MSQCAASRDDRAGDRHRQHELAQRQLPRRLEHLGLDLEPVAEQDHDQRDDREVVHEARARRRTRAPPSPPSPSTKPASTNSAVSDRNERRASPDDERAHHQQAAEDEQHGLEAHRARVCAASSPRRRASRRAHHRARQVAVLAGRGRSLQRLPGRGGRLPPAARLRQRRVLQAAALRRLRRRRRGRDLAPARRPLPRPRAVLLRAHLRAAPAAGAGRRLARAPTTRPARGCTCRPAPPSCSAAWSAPGATRT